MQKTQYHNHFITIEERNTPNRLRVRVGWEGTDRALRTFWASSYEEALAVGKRSVDELLLCIPDVSKAYNVLRAADDAQRASHHIHHTAKSILDEVEELSKEQLTEKLEALVDQLGELADNTTTERGDACAELESLYNDLVDNKDAVLCDNSADSPPCPHLSNPDGELDDCGVGLCIDCQQGKDEALSYRETIERRELRRQGVERKEAIAATDPQRASYYEEVDLRRRERLAALRREAEEA